MTMLPIYRKCKACGRRYSWNPDVGQINCPYCHGMGRIGKKVLDKVLNKKS